MNVRCVSIGIFALVFITLLIKNCPNGADGSQPKTIKPTKYNSTRIKFVDTGSPLLNEAPLTTRLQLRIRADGGIRPVEGQPLQLDSIRNLAKGYDDPSKALIIWADDEENISVKQFFSTVRKITNELSPTFKGEVYILVKSL